MTSAKGDAGRPLIELRDAKLGYGPKVILESVNLSIHAGDFLGVVGPNGAGKTTLLKAMLGIVSPIEGEVSCRALLGYSPQRSSLDPIFPLTVEEVVEMGTWRPKRGTVPSLTREEQKRRVAASLERCGMLERLRAPFRDLSGGQKQRVLVARALVSDPELLVLDEPTNDLDLRGEAEVMDLVSSLHAAGRTVVMVTHLLHLVSRYAEKLVLVDRGRLEHGTLAEMLNESRLERMYSMPIAVEETPHGRMIVPRRTR